MPRPMLVGAVVAVVWVLVVAALPERGGAPRPFVDTVSKQLAASGGRLAPKPGAVLHVYVAPTGSDDNDGTTPDRAVRSLAAAQRLIAAAHPSTDVEIRIQQGRYVAAPLEWSAYVPGHTIAFLPFDYQFGQRSAAAGRPVFRGDGHNGFWLRAVRQPSGARLAFYFLHIEGYSAGAIAFDGGTPPAGGQQPTVQAAAATNGNIVYSMVFRELGSKYVRGGLGFGAVDLINSQNNLIQNNTFESLENAGSAGDAGLVHGVYLSHHSSKNLIRDNHFRLISGDPIRTRDDSGENKIFGNTFVRTGSNAFFSDWFSTKADQGVIECASRANVFYDNTLVSGYRGPIDPWWTIPLDAGYAARGCAADTQARVHAWGNRQQ